MCVIEEILELSKNGWDEVLLNYICENFDILECEFNRDEYNEPKKHNYDFCIHCNKAMLLDNQKIDFSLYELWPM